MKTRKQTIELLKQIAVDLRNLQQKVLFNADLMDNYDSASALWARDIYSIAQDIQVAYDKITPFLPIYLQEILQRIDEDSNSRRDLQQEAVF